jgi:hypothetical protein
MVFHSPRRRRCRATGKGQREQTRYGGPTVGPDCSHGPEQQSVRLLVIIELPIHYAPAERFGLWIEIAERN